MREGSLILSNKAYDALKYLAQILLPALGTLYFALAQIWGLPSAEEVAGTVLAVDTFLGVVLKLSHSAYQQSDAAFDGELQIVPNAEGDGGVVSLHPKLDPDTIARTKDEVRFKVKT